MLINTLNTLQQWHQWNHEKVAEHTKRITKIKPYIYKYNKEGINYTPEKDYWKKNEKNSLMLALNVLYAKKEK